MGPVMSYSPMNTLRERPVFSSVTDTTGMDVRSPFGPQGLSRNTIQILKPNCIERLAITLALKGNKDQIRDPEFVSRQLSLSPEWQEEFQIVHLVERSLWLQGH